MATVKIYNIEGQETGTVELSAALFEVSVNPALVHEAVVAQSANARDVIAHAKDRSEVRGGGRKPWKQKGTGRARHGSRRSPIWSGGGVTFGPQKIRNFARKINAKAKRKALAMVLSDKVSSNQFVVVEKLDVVDAKTKQLSGFVKKLPIEGKKMLLIAKPENTSVALAAQNIQNVSTLPSNSLNVIDLLRHDSVVVTKLALEQIEEIYGKK